MRRRDREARWNPRSWSGREVPVACVRGVDTEFDSAPRRRYAREDTRVRRGYGEGWILAIGHDVTVTKHRDGRGVGSRSYKRRAVETELQHEGVRRRSLRSGDVDLGSSDC